MNDPKSPEDTPKRGPGRPPKPKAETAPEPKQDINQAILKALENLSGRIEMLETAEKERKDRPLVTTGERLDEFKFNQVAPEQPHDMFAIPQVYLVSHEFEVVEDGRRKTRREWRLKDFPEKHWRFVQVAKQDWRKSYNGGNYEVVPYDKVFTNPNHLPFTNDNNTVRVMDTIMMWNDRKIYEKQVRRYADLADFRERGYKDSFHNQVDKLQARGIRTYEVEKDGREHSQI